MPWAVPISSPYSTPSSCVTIPSVWTILSATVSSSIPVTCRRCSTLRWRLPAIIRSTTCSRSDSGAASRPDIPRSTSCAVWRIRRVLWVRAMPWLWAPPSPSASWLPASASGRLTRPTPISPTVPSRRRFRRASAASPATWALRISSCTTIPTTSSSRPRSTRSTRRMSLRSTKHGVGTCCPSTDTTSTASVRLSWPPTPKPSGRPSSSAVRPWARVPWPPTVRATRTRFRPTASRCRPPEPIWPPRSATSGAIPTSLSLSSRRAARFSVPAAKRSRHGPPSRPRSRRTGARSIRSWPAGSTASSRASFPRSTTSASR